jgi:hypothetical protein
MTGTSRCTYGGARVWKHRPFTRVVKGRRAERILRDYIKLNELEARGEIPYQKHRLRGLGPELLHKLRRMPD